MKIIINEIKKIWNLKILALITIINVLFFLIFMEFNISCFPNGHPFTEYYNFSEELTLQYGTTLEKHEFDEFAKKREELVEQAENYIARDAIFSAAGIYNYEDYYKFVNSSKEKTKEEDIVLWRLSGKECDFVEFKIAALDSMINDYKDARVYYKDQILETDRPKEIKRLQEILDTQQYKSIMHYHTIGNTSSYILWFSILAVLSVLILLSPLLVADKMRGVNVLQYTSKKGRKLLLSQLWAVLISAFLLTTIQLIVVGGIYSTKGTHIFWENGMNSFIGRTSFWFDMTYGQYILYALGMIYLCSIGTALIAYVIAGISQHYIQLILKLVPVFILLALLCKSVFDVCFSMDNTLYQLTGIVGIEVIACSIMLVLGSLLCIVFAQRMKKIDI